MSRILIDEKGRKVIPDLFVQEVYDKDGISIVNGSASCDALETSGYRYGTGHLDSFCQIFDAAAIRMRDEEYIAWQTHCEDYSPSDLRPDARNGTVIIFEYACGNGSAYPQPNGYFELSVDNEPVVRFSMKKHNHLFEGRGGIRLFLEIKRKRAEKIPGNMFSLDDFIRDESIYVNGAAYLYLPKAYIKGKTNITLKITGHNREEGSMRWFRAGFNYFLLSGDLRIGYDAVRAGRSAYRIDNRTVYFGDIHIHTAQTATLKEDGCGTGTASENLRYAREVSGLDFAAITDHDWQMNAADWKAVRDKNEEYNEEGRFVALNAYEWTSDLYGHRNVYFRDGSNIPSDLKPFNYQKEPYKEVKYGVTSPEDPNPEDLWQWLQDHKLQAVTIPHHPNTEQFIMDFFKFFHPAYDRCVEVYSCWGSFFETARRFNLCSERIEEYGYKRYGSLLHFGFAASSDGHDGNGGEANLTKNRRHMAHYSGSGRIAVYAESLTRESVYDAIFNRSCYATTGEPILLSVKLNGQDMGGELTCRPGIAQLTIHAVGTSPIDGVKIYSNETVLALPLTDKSCEFKYEMELDIIKDCSVYAEIEQDDGEMAWSSPIEVRIGKD